MNFSSICLRLPGNCFFGFRPFLQIEIWAFVIRIFKEIPQFSGSFHLESKTLASLLAERELHANSRCAKDNWRVPVVSVHSQRNSGPAKEN